MRVQLGRPQAARTRLGRVRLGRVRPGRGRVGGDGGAVAVLTAALMVVFIGLAAFATDFGVAYSAKRQLQTAADAASLAAAAEYAGYPGDCNVLAQNTAARAAAQRAADGYRAQNASWGSGPPIEVTCSADLASLQVRVVLQATTKTTFGAVLGISTLTATRQAAAALRVPPDADLVRPYAVCADDLAALTANPLSFAKVSYPNSSCGSQAGNWYTVRCPDQGQSGSSTLADNVLRGCGDPIAVVAGQPAPPDDPNPALIAACGGEYDADCLQGDPGANFADSKLIDAWDSLLGRMILLPVFNAGSVTGTGTNTRYPVRSLLAVQVCGYRWGRDGSNATSAGACAGAHASTGGNTENYLLLHYTRLLTSGSYGPSTCKLGDLACDAGARRVQLVE